MDYAAKLALFLFEDTGSIFGCSDSKLFGCYVGRGNIVIDGENETICNRVYGGSCHHDSNIIKWSELGY